MTATNIVQSYFSMMRDHNLGVVDLFHEDAVLLGLGMRVSGKEAIRTFYTNAIEAGGPQPTLLGPLMTDGSRVAAEIQIELSEGSTLHVVDMFHIEEDKIRLLNYFLADEPEGEA